MIILIGGLQKNQTIKTDGICTTLAAAMGMGGGYVPLVLMRNYDNEQDNSIRKPAKRHTEV